ncbi:carboxylesterase [Karstenula rhodostoma CBS 690.94]|uniref:Carboxylesterase n=1 Tax=Karstenula rhodostoma CBS 690.94 TaxID=1392251 RepID=A0A9P4PI26_9PLEO|nr:carboxylesterase [Karstenula rhodostoma CBS 690.94]
MATLTTPFGSFKGKYADGVVQYLGIPYATLKNQLSAPEMVFSYKSVVDATEYGPRAPAPDTSLFEQQFLIQSVIDDTPSPRMSGTECLNLNITVPSSIDPESVNKLPVMVFIHGGGFLMGSNSAPYFDPSRFVALSAELGTPVIVVSINYRLAVLGNLTSSELRAAGYPGNNALQDQKCALQWIRSHIEGFGGDANNVTAFGVSAGSVAVLTQLFSTEPLFKRAIAMSGTPMMLKPLPAAVAEVTYNSIMEALGLENASVEERIRRLITISPEELVEKTPMTARLAPFLDGDILPEAVTFDKLASRMVIPGMKWCGALMIGDCQHDVTTAILDAYGITPSISDDIALKHTINLATDILYATSALYYARAWPGKRYVYHFNEGNPWEGQFKGMATHMLDAACLFQNYNHETGEHGKDVAGTLANGFIAFTNGMEPWDSIAWDEFLAGK